MAAVAAPWYVEPSVSAETVYQSNPQFYYDEPRHGTGELLILQLPVDWNDEHSKFLAQPTINAGETQGASGLGQHNKSVAMSWVSKWDVASLRANANVARLDLFGANVTDLGLVRPTGYSNNQSYDLGATLSPSEREQVDLDGAASSTFFHQSGRKTFIDYRYSKLTGQYTWTASPRTQLLVTASASDFAPSGGGVASNERSLQLGASHQLSESVLLTGTFGRSQVTEAGRPGTTSGNVYAGTLTWTHPTTNVTLTARQSRQPGSIGDLALENDLAATWAWSVSDRLRYTLGGSVTKLTDRFVGFDLTQRNYYTAEWAAYYLVTPQWRLEFHLTDTRVELPAALLQQHALSATSVGGLLSLTRAFGRTKLI